MKSDESPLFLGKTTIAAVSYVCSCNQRYIIFDRKLAQGQGLSVGECVQAIRRFASEDDSIVVVADEVPEMSCRVCDSAIEISKVVQEAVDKHSNAN